MGWGALKNGDLLRQAEGQFEAFISTDQNLKYQQLVVGGKLAILVEGAVLELSPPTTSTWMLARPRDIPEHTPDRHISPIAIDQNALLRLPDWWSKSEWVC